MATKEQTTRGPTGSVRGVPEDVANAWLVEAVDEVGETFTRAELKGAVAEVVGKRGKMDAATRVNVVDGLVLALERAALHWKVGTGEYERPATWRVELENRSWRYSVGRVSLPEASLLVEMLELYDASQGLDDYPRLQGIRDRVGKAVDQLLQGAT